MRWLRIFDGAYRRARRAEGRGDYRAAAALYAEADLPEEAASALLVHAARQTDVEVRLTSLRDALRWLAPGSERWREVQTQVGMTLLEQAQRRSGAPTRDERHSLEEAAERLETAERFSEAVTAYELLDRTEDVARCLQRSGDIDKLEALLQETTTDARRKRELRTLVNEYEMSLAHGARREALQALHRAIDLSPDDGDLADLLRSLENRMVRGRRLRLRVGGAERAFVGGREVTLGREGDVAVRGTGVSRRHVTLALGEQGVLVKDLGSRNGTLLRGIPIAGEMIIEGETELGLGDDVAVLVRPAGEALFLKVLRGQDRDLVVWVGDQPLRDEGLGGHVRFDEEGYATFVPVPGGRTLLGRQKVAEAIVLLREDKLDVDGTPVEVV